MFSIPRLLNPNAESNRHNENYLLYRFILQTKRHISYIYLRNTAH